MDIEEKWYRGYKIEIGYDEYPDDPRSWDNVATFVCRYRGYCLGDTQDVDGEINHLLDECIEPSSIVEYFAKNRKAKKEVLDNGDFAYLYFDENGYEDELPFFKSAPLEDVAILMAEELTTEEKLELIEQSDNCVILPISLYDHSGIAMWIGGTAGHPDSRWDCTTVGFAYITKKTAKENGIDVSAPKWKEWANEVINSEMVIYNEYVIGEVYGYCIYSSEGECVGSCSGFYGLENITCLMEYAMDDIDSFIESKKKENVQIIEK